MLGCMLTATRHCIFCGRDSLIPCNPEAAHTQRWYCLQVAINWCICQDAIPIPGARNMQQAQGNLGSLGWQLTDEELAALEETADRVPRAMIQNIFQTS